MLSKLHDCVHILARNTGKQLDNACSKSRIFFSAITVLNTALLNRIHNVLDTIAIPYVTLFFASVRPYINCCYTFVVLALSPIPSAYVLIV